MLFGPELAPRWVGSGSMRPTILGMRWNNLRSKGISEMQLTGRLLIRGKKDRQI